MLRSKGFLLGDSEACGGGLLLVDCCAASGSQQETMALWAQLFLICGVGIVALALPKTGDIQGGVMRSCLEKALQTMGYTRA